LLYPLILPIAEHDLQTNVGKAIKFLDENRKVKVTCMFKAREITHPELGKKKLELFAEMVGDHGTVERVPTLDGRLMIMVLLPKPNVVKKKVDAKDQNKQDGGQAVQNHGNREDNPAEVSQQPPVPPQESVSEETA